MYDITINYKLGDYVKDELGKIYQIIRIYIEIEFSRKLMKNVAYFNLELVDTRNPWGNSYNVPAQRMRKTDKKEVNEYIYHNKLANSDKSQTKPSKERSIEKGRTESKYKCKGRVNEMIENKGELKKERTTDDILDEVIGYKSLAYMLGDEDGKYEKNIQELSQEFNRLTENKELSCNN